MTVIGIPDGVHTTIKSTPRTWTPIVAIEIRARDTDTVGKFTVTCLADIEHCLFYSLRRQWYEATVIALGTGTLFGQHLLNRWFIQHP
mmetsp:Transcript_21362/g.37579  ORF Transcript_21362/g.37579 Transcript_21362/m.37579 type:complete len:88 (+) Transcript_21362:2873-3136(+)